MGQGSVTSERLLVWALTAFATAGAVGVEAMTDPGWNGWQWAVLVVLLVDVTGGIPANGLGSAKRFYHSPAPVGASLLHRFMRHPVGFAAAHMHPFALAAVFDLPWLWACAWYFTSLLGSASVVAAPLYLQRPLALAVCTLAILGAAATTSLPVWWFGPLLVLKLVLAHAVTEEPYRPGDSAPRVAPRDRVDEPAA
jgi:hypothetical protein